MNNQLIRTRSLSAFQSAIALAAFLVLSFSVQSQTRYQSAGGVKIVILGTSNIHDWEMKSDKGSGTAEFTQAADGTLSAASAISFSMPAESLKSEHTAMDNNTYKALKTGKYSTISFSAASASLRHTGAGNYVLTAPGKLTISGVTRDIQLTANCVLNADHSISISGAYTLNMTDYKVDPPSIMFGAIKTGNGITVKFNFLMR